MVTMPANVSGAYGKANPALAEGQSLYAWALEQKAREPDIIRQSLRSMIQNHLTRRQIEAQSQRNRGLGGNIGGGLGAIGGALLGIGGGPAGMLAGAALGGTAGSTAGSLFDPAPVSPADWMALGAFAPSPIYEGGGGFGGFGSPAERSHNYPATATPPINPGY